VFQEWCAMIWYSAAPSDSIAQPDGVGLDTIMTNGDGLTSSIPQLAVLFATTP
jgi:hypothetical protein